jgi:pimeloyl-ACP methyl ester carboxylesterase
MIIAIILFICFILVLLLAITGSPQKCWTDINAPLNFIMYQEPKHQYSSQSVNVWIDKTWRGDGERIPCHLETYDDSKRSLIIYSHGANENLLNCIQFSRKLAKELKSDVLSYDYSGYGINPFDKFERTAEGMNLTLQTIFDTMLKDYEYKPTDITLWGYSLGSGPTLALSSKVSNTGRNVKGTIIYGAFTSVKNVISDKTHEKIAGLFSERWNNQESIKKVSNPILILHGEHDDVISVKHASELHKINPNSKLVILPASGHGNFNWNIIIKEIRQWQ